MRTASTELRYYHSSDFTSSAGRFWYVGKPKSKKIRTGAPRDTTASAYTTVYDYRYPFAEHGLPFSSRLDGIYASYEYHDDGTVETESVGGRLTTYEDYLHGVARKVTVAGIDGEHVRSVNEAGDVTDETDREGRTTVYEYDEAARLDRIVSPAPLSPVEIDYPDWNATTTDGRVQVRQQAGRVEQTYYDKLGREVRHEVSGADVSTVYRGTSYDSSGNVAFVSDPTSRRYAALIIGNRFEYDALGRLVRRKHSGATGSVDLCHGPDCNEEPPFSGITTIGNGVAVSDEDGYLSVYTFRTFGDPSDAQLVRIDQQIVKPDELAPAFGERTAVTTVERNVAGFVTEVHRDAENGGVARSYTPYVNSGGGDPVDRLRDASGVRHPDRAVARPRRSGNAGPRVRLIDLSPHLRVGSSHEDRPGDQRDGCGPRSTHDIHLRCDRPPDWCPADAGGPDFRV